MQTYSGGIPQRHLAFPNQTLTELVESHGSRPVESLYGVSRPVAVESFDNFEGEVALDLVAVSDTPYTLTGNRHRRTSPATRKAQLSWQFFASVQRSACEAASDEM